MRLKHRSFLRKGAAFSLAVFLAAGSIPAASLAVEKKDSDTALIDQMLLDKEYIEGEAIVVMREKEKPNGQKNVSTITMVKDDVLELSVEGGFSDKISEAQDRMSGEDDSYTIEFVSDHTKTTRQLLEQLYQDPDVISAEPNYEIKTMSAEGESLADSIQVSSAEDSKKTGDLSSLQWYMSDELPDDARAPSSFGNTRYSLNVPDWNDNTRTNSSGTIAIMDTGMNVTHPDLQGALYTFSEEQQKKYGCGPHGYNAAEYNNQVAEAYKTEDAYRRDVTDHDGHGTHLAGIVAADWNGEGVSGIANGAKIFSVRVFDDSGDITGVYQWKHDGRTYMIAEVGVVYVIAEKSIDSPEAQEIDVKSFTRVYIDDVAVGDSEASVGPYFYMNGTSMAAPSVSGSLAIIAKDEPNSADTGLTEEKLKDEALTRKAKLLASVDYDEDLSKLCRTGGRVNLHHSSTFEK